MAADEAQQVEKGPALLKTESTVRGFLLKVANRISPMSCLLYGTYERRMLLHDHKHCAAARRSFLYIFRSCQAVVPAFILSTLFIRTRLHPDNPRCPCQDAPDPSSSPTCMPHPTSAVRDTDSVCLLAQRWHLLPGRAVLLPGRSLAGSRAQADISLCFDPL